MVVNVWISCLEPESDQACILAIGDNTSAIGWLHHTAHIEPNGVTQAEGTSKSGKETGPGTHQVQLLPGVAACEGGVERGSRPTVVRGRGEGKTTPTSLRPTTQRCTNRTFYPVLPLAGNGALQNIPVAQRNIILGHTSSANRRIIFDGQQESSNESYDRLWRRWKGYCDHVGYRGDVYLDKLSIDERGLFTKAFLSFYQTAEWSKSGEPSGTRAEPLVSNTLRQATSNLATAFRLSVRQSPVHVQGSSHLHPTIRRLLRAGDNTDPPKAQQRAITPKLLRAMYHRAGRRGGGVVEGDTRSAVVADIAIIAYFFAMRSCEITTTPQRGRTKIVRLSGVTFRDAKGRELDFRNHVVLDSEATRVTITFEDQRDG